MDDSKVFMFPEGSSRGSIDPALLLALTNGGGFGNNGGWIWILFMWMMYQNGGFFGNGFGPNGGTGFLANQMNNDAGRDLILQALNGRADALGQIVQITNGSVETVKTVLGQINTAIQTTGLQTINAQQLGDAAISRQICECCCENRLAIANQTNALQSQMASNHAAATLQAAQAEAADQLAVCQQTNTLSNQADRNTNSIVKAISDQNAMIVKEFCDLKERELQNKIDTQGDIITQLRNQISNDKQTLQFNAAFHALDDKIDAIAAKQPNTVPVQWPNLIAANATPSIGGCGWNNNLFGNGFGNNIVF